MVSFLNGQKPPHDSSIHAKILEKYHKVLHAENKLQMTGDSQASKRDFFRRIYCLEGYNCAELVRMEKISLGLGR